jgi:hypothetical protein
MRKNDWWDDQTALFFQRGQAGVIGAGRTKEPRFFLRLLIMDCCKKSSHIKDLQGI